MNASGLASITRSTASSSAALMSSICFAKSASERTRLSTTSSPGVTDHTIKRSGGWTSLYSRSRDHVLARPASKWHPRQDLRVLPIAFPLRGQGRARPAPRLALGPRRAMAANPTKGRARDKRGLSRERGGSFRSLRACFFSRACPLPPSFAVALTSQASERRKGAKPNVSC